MNTKIIYPGIKVTIPKGNVDPSLKLPLGKVGNIFKSLGSSIKYEKKLVDAGSESPKVVLNSAIIRNPDQAVLRKIRALLATEGYNATYLGKPKKCENISEIMI